MIIESLPREFLRFFAPGIAAGMDPAKKIAFLDKELLELLPDEDKRLAPQRVDKLVKVPMLDGSQVTLHCEVQGSSETNFSSRMHRYYICLEGKYPGEVTGIAILTDDSKHFRPGPFREIRGPKKVHRLCYDYAVYKILDQPEETLEQSDNPFALVILTVKAALERVKGKYTEEEYLRRKLELADWPKKKPITDHQEKALLTFLKYYVPLKDRALEIKFEEQLKERSNSIGIVEGIINEEREKGFEQGLQRGREETERNKDLTFVQTLIRNTEYNDEEIASLVKVDVRFVRRIRRLGMQMSKMRPNE